ncbi:RAVE protein 1 C terminal-domain-containing protein [Paraphysoderma sedebokerense]|nr:RAVE protein 1 C terminal-domain-containing protein [Paraphysoderma sedebokerense]
MDLEIAHSLLSCVLSSMIFKIEFLAIFALLSSVYLFITITIQDQSMLERVPKAVPVPGPLFVPSLSPIHASSVYGSGLSVYIYNLHSQKLIQTISYRDSDECPSAVDVNRNNATIAAAYGETVVLYSLNQPREKTDVKWKFVVELTHSFRTKCLSWSATGALLTAGQQLVFWVNEKKEDGEVGWQAVWKCRSTSDITLAAFSPDGSLFATAGQYDRRVKVWARTDREVQATRKKQKAEFNFTYLVHPRSILNFEWRSIPEEDTSYTNILLTNCRDQVARFWSQSHAHKSSHTSIYRSTSLSFVLSVSIDPAQYPSLTESSISTNSVIPVLHWLDTNEMHVSLTTCERTPVLVPTGVNPVPAIAKSVSAPSSDWHIKTMSSANLFNSPSKKGAEANIQRLKAVLRDYQSLVFSVQADNSLVIWGIQNLSTNPPRIPKVIAVIKLTSVLPDSDSSFQFFSSKCIQFNPEQPVINSVPAFPSPLSSATPTLNMLSIHLDGRMQLHEMNLVEFLVGLNVPKLNRLETWWGHNLKTESSDSKLPTPELLNVSGYLLSRVGRELLICVNEAEPKMGSCRIASASSLKQLARMTLPQETVLVAVQNGPYFGIFHTSNGALELHEILDETTQREAKFIGEISMNEFATAKSKPIISINSDRCDKTSGKTEFAINIIDVESAAFSRIVLQLSVGVLSKVSSASFKLPSSISTGNISQVLPGQSNPLYCVVTSEQLLQVWRYPDTAVQSSESNAANKPDHSTGWIKLGEGKLPPKTGAVNKLIIGQQTVVITYESSEMDIFNVPIVGSAMALTNRIANTGTPTSMSIFSALDGTDLIAISTEKDVKIYSTRVLESVGATVGTAWEPSISIDQDHIESLTWTEDGSLVGSREGQIIVMEKWQQSITKDSSDPLLLPHLFHLHHNRASPLPDYHPYAVTQYLLWGKYEVVKRIYNTLYYYVKYTFAPPAFGETNPVDDSVKMKNMKIPNVPFETMWDLINNEGTTSTSSQQYTALFGAEDGNLDSDIDDIHSFTKDKAAFLVDHLTRISLPRISNVEQMYLMAIIDTVIQIDSHRRALDANGIRYLLFLRLFIYLRKSLPQHLRPPSLTHENIAWAFFSDSKDVLLDFSVNAYSASNSLLWTDAKQLGLGWWMSGGDILKRQAETIARNQYMHKDEKNPVNCTLFYIALRKKKLLHGLWKQANGHPEQITMMNFLSNDFAEARWQKAALKNAFVLLGKQRYEYAAAFFLLGDSLSDAVNVCIKNLDDPQLAIMLCRIYDGDDSTILMDILSKQLLPSAIEKGDRTMAAMCYWLLKEKTKALQATLLPLDTIDSASSTAASPSDVSRSVDATVEAPSWVLYKHLSAKLKTLHITESALSPRVESEIVCQIVCRYYNMNIPVLSAYVLDDWDKNGVKFIPDESKTIHLSCKEEKVVTSGATVTDDKLNTGVVDFTDWGFNSSPSVPSEASKENKYDDLFGPSSSNETSKPKDKYDDLFGPTEPSKPKDKYDDLFGPTESTQPKDKYDDLFGSTEPVKPKDKYDDLFGPTESTQRKDKYDDLFGQTEPAKSNDTYDDLFDGKDSGSVPQISTPMVPKSKMIRVGPSDAEILSCKEKLARRLIWNVVDGGLVLAYNEKLIKDELFFEDYSQRMSASLQKISNQFNVAATKLATLIEEVCVQFGMIRHLSELIKCQILNEHSDPSLLTTHLLHQCVAGRALLKACLEAEDTNMSSSLIRLNLEILCVTRYENEDSSIIRSIVMDAFFGLWISLLLSREYASLSVLVKQSPIFLQKLLHGSLEEVKSTIDETLFALAPLIGKPIPVHYDYGFTDFIEHAKFAESVVRYVSNRYILSVMNIGLAESTFDTGLFKPLHSWFNHFVRLTAGWEKSILTKFSNENADDIRDHISGDNQKTLWSSLTEWVEKEHLLHNLSLRNTKETTIAIPTAPLQIDLESAVDTTKPTDSNDSWRIETVMKSDLPVWSCAYSEQAPEMLLIAGPKTVMEVHMETTWMYTKVFNMPQTNYHVQPI